jgi:hypothetical protein
MLTKVKEVAVCRAVSFCVIMDLLLKEKDMKRSAKKRKVNKGVLAAIGATVLGIAAGAAAMFFSKKENREAVKKTVKSTVRKGKMEVAKAKRKIVATKKKLIKK